MKPSLKPSMKSFNETEFKFEFTIILQAGLEIFMFDFASSGSVIFTEFMPSSSIFFGFRLSFSNFVKFRISSNFSQVFSR